MKYLPILVALVSGTIAFSEPSHATNVDDNALIDNAKQIIKNDLLFEPDKAKFKNMKVVANGDGYVVCGEADSLNAAGSYVGFKKIAVTNGQIIWVKNLAETNPSGGLAKYLRAEYEMSRKKYFSLGCP